MDATSHKNHGSTMFHWQATACVKGKRTKASTNVFHCVPLRGLIDIVLMLTGMFTVIIIVVVILLLLIISSIPIIIVIVIVILIVIAIFLCIIIIVILCLFYIHIYISITSISISSPSHNSSNSSRLLAAFKHLPGWRRVLQDIPFLESDLVWQARRWPCLNERKEPMEGIVRDWNMLTSHSNWCIAAYSGA